MKKFGIILFIVGILFAVARMSYRTLVVKPDYQQSIGGYWELADRSSTLAEKSEYIDKFVNALEKENLSGVYDALFVFNPQDGFDQNLKSLKTLQYRLKEIKNMDENSFAYQTALQQITQQEQGEASPMINTLNRCWAKQNYYTFWNFYLIFTFLMVQVSLISFGWYLFQDN